ncbi:MAG: histidine kinase dimerization/phosphoacceptor domain -containing protein, partial [Balneolaceae bacterium]|nr:histidine kinase dimerization/phosphoacceptor domain -containing protein [Balneolaceae bacterium]
FEWGFIPVFITGFILAHTTFMPVYWASLFGIAFVLGLAILALSYYSIPVSIRLDSLKSVFFYIGVSFVAALASSLGSFVWSLFHNLSPAETMTIWMAWWSGLFLQAIVLVGPCLYFFTPTIERIKARYFSVPEVEVSMKWIYSAIVSVVVVLTLFILGANMLGSMGLDQELAMLPESYRDDFLKLRGSFQIIFWISIALVLGAGLGGIYLVGSWNKSLTEKVREQTRQLEENEETLKVALEERDTLLKEIHSRINNNLTMVLALLELQLKGNEEKPHEDILKDTYARLRTMALLYETMHQTDSINFVSIKTYTLKLSNRLSQHYKKRDRNIDVSIDAEDVKLKVDRAVPFAMILNELLVNAYVHAFKDLKSGTIFIELKRKNGQIMLAVRDNGIGLPTRFSISDQDSLGMKIIQTLTRQLQGELFVDRQERTGFVLWMPIISPAA